MQESGVRNGAYGADKFGLQGLKAVHWNLTEPRLYEFSIAAKEAEVTAGLEDYESVFESLRTVVGRRRKRRRRSGQTREVPASGSTETSPERPAGGEEADPEDTGEDL